MELGRGVRLSNTLWREFRRLEVEVCEFVWAGCRTERGPTLLLRRLLRACVARDVVME